MSKIFEYIKKYDILILLVFGFLIYFPSLFYDILSYDDLPYIINNEYLNGQLSVRFIDFFIPKFIRDDIYTPLTFLVYWSIIKIFGINAFAFHFVNVLFYILSSVALFYLLKKLISNYSLAFFATILYILHPCHIECTAWISAMGYNIAGLFFYLSFLYFILGFDENKNINYIYSVIFYILAIFSQPIAVTLPAILVLWAYCFRRERLKESIKYICAYIPFLFIYIFLFKKTVSNSRFHDLFEYNFLEKISFLGQYVFNSFIPINLCPIQPIPSLFSILYFIIFIIILFLFRKNIIFLFFASYWFISILPYSNIFFPTAIPVADRYLLLSSISSCVLISYISFYIFNKFKDKMLVKYISFFFFLMIYLISYFIYLPVWKEYLALWNYSYRINPTDVNIKQYYSKCLILFERYDEAIILADEIIKDKPDLFDGYEIKILALMKKNALKDAIDVCFIVKNIMPNNYMNYLYLFDIYAMQEEYDKASKYLEYGYMTINKNNLYKNERKYLLAKRYLTISYVNADIDKFIENLKIISNDFNLFDDNCEFSKILGEKKYRYREEICLNYLKKYNTQYSVYVINLLSCLYMKETYKEDAQKVMRSLLKEMNKAQNFISKGDNNSAEHIYLSIILKNKYMYEAYCNLGILYLRTNRQIEAKKIFDKVLEINPNDEQIKQILVSLGENTKNE